jgi:hypothetical protein
MEWELERRGMKNPSIGLWRWEFFLMPLDRWYSCSIWTHVLIHTTRTPHTRTPLVHKLDLQLHTQNTHVLSSDSCGMNMRGRHWRRWDTRKFTPVGVKPGRVGRPLPPTPLHYERVLWRWEFRIGRKGHGNSGDELRLIYYLGGRVGSYILGALGRSDTKGPVFTVAELF